MLQTKLELCELLKLVSDITDADLRQESLLALLTAGAVTADEAKAIVKRVRYLRDWHQRQDRKRYVTLPDAEEAVVDDEDGLPLGVAYEAVLALPNHYRKVILLRYVSGYSATELARTLGVNRRTITRWTNAAIKRLQRVPLSARRTP